MGEKPITTELIIFTVAVHPFSTEVTDGGDAWQLYRHIEFDQHTLLRDTPDYAEYTATLCGRRLMVEKTLYYDDPTDCPDCINIVRFVRNGVKLRRSND